MAHKTVQKTFLVGDSWLYYKLYCGVQTADTLLTDVIQTLTDALLEQKKIAKWFFIRYTDPNPHLRVRFLVKYSKDVETITTMVKNRLTPFIETQQLWEIQLATYQREIERYGTNTIEHAESFFFYDSQQVVWMLQNVQDDTTRFLQVFWWIEQMLLLFEWDTKQQLSFLDRMQQQFKEEFKITQSVRKSLGKKYRGLESQLSKIPPVKVLNKEAVKKTIHKLLLLDKENQLEVLLENLLASYIHMSINRSFVSQQRLYEMMLYDFLHKKYQSKFARYGRI